MNDLPRLLKPYYSIEETFKRLNLAGANLDTEGDIYLLASENNISIHVLLHYPATLLKDSLYKPHFQRNVETPILMIPRYLFKGDIRHAIGKVEAEHVDTEHVDRENEDSYRDFLSDRQEEKGLEEPVFELLSNQRPLTVKPMKVAVDYSRHIRGMYAEPEEYDFFNEIFNSHLPAAVNFEDEAYYVCRPHYYLDKVRHKVTFKDGRIFYPRYQIENDAVHFCVEDKAFFITKASIQNFEREYLGVNHGLDTIEKPPYLDCENEYYAREIEIAIEAHTAIFSNNEGNNNASSSARVRTWLEKKYPNNSDAFYERITTVVLPKKNK